MNDLEKDIIEQFKTQIESRDKIINELLDMHQKDQESTKNLILNITKIFGKFVIIPVCAAFTICFCVFLWGYFWSDYNVTTYSNSYNESAGNLTIDRGEK